MKTVSDKLPIGQVQSSQSGPSWHLRHSRTLLYASLPFCMAGVGLSCFMDGESWLEALIGMRQLFGLWSLSFLLAAMLIGPLTRVIPWIPLKAHLVLARRAVGISAFLFAVAHSLCYVVPVMLRNWRETYLPGLLWVAGLILGAIAFVGMATLAFTSRDKSVVRLGGKKWKRLHQLTYILLPLVLVHAIFVGPDFGVNRGPDVKGEPDMGALFGFLALSVLWLTLFIMRKNGVRWRGKKPTGNT